MYGDTKTSKDRMKKGSSKDKAIEKAKGHVATAKDRKKDPYLSADSIVYKKNNK